MIPAINKLTIPIIPEITENNSYWVVDNPKTNKYTEELAPIKSPIFRNYPSLIVIPLFIIILYFSKNYDKSQIKKRACRIPTSLGNMRKRFNSY